MLLRDPEFDIGPDLLGQVQGPLMQPHRGFHVSRSLGHDRDEAQAFDLAPVVAAVGEVAERHGGQFARAVQLIVGAFHAGEVEAGQRHEFGVFDRRRFRDGALQQRTRGAGVTPIHGKPAEVVEREHLPTRVARALEVLERLAKGVLRAAEVALLRQRRGDVLLGDAAQAGMFRLRRHLLEHTLRRGQIAATEQQIAFGDARVGEGLGELRFRGQALGGAGGLQSFIPLAAIAQHVRHSRVGLDAGGGIGGMLSGRTENLQRPIQDTGPLSPHSVRKQVSGIWHQICSPTSHVGSLEKTHGEVVMHVAKTGKMILLAALVAACAEPTASTMAHREGAALVSSSPVLVECPTDVSTEASALITPLGGVVTAGGASISVPAGAVLVPTTITVKVPASQYMEVDITADGAAHFTFQSPVTVSVSYARCTRSDINKTPLSIWYIDSATKALLANMGGTDDKSARTVTFSTDHLSGYALAN